MVVPWAAVGHTDTMLIRRSCRSGRSHGEHDVRIIGRVRTACAATRFRRRATPPLSSLGTDFNDARYMTIRTARRTTPPPGDGKAPIRLAAPMMGPCRDARGCQLHAPNDGLEQQPPAETLRPRKPPRAPVHARHLRWPLVGWCSRMGGRKAITASIRRRRSATSRSGRRPSRMSRRQEGEVGESDEPGHAPVEHREPDREARGIGHERDDQRQQRQGHQEGDGRFAPHQLAQAAAADGPSCLPLAHVCVSRHVDRMTGRATFPNGFGA